MSGRGGADGGELAKQFGGDQAVVEWSSFVANDLDGLVTFAGDQDAVTRLGEQERASDRAAPVGFDVEFGVAGREAGEDVLNDLSRRFRSRVVTGDDGRVGVRSRLGQERSLRAVAVAAGSKEADDFARRERLEIVDDAAEGIVCVSVIDENAKRLSGVDSLKPTGHAGKLFDAGCDGFRTGSEMEGDGRCCQAVHHVVPGREGGCDFKVDAFDRAWRRADSEACTVEGFVENARVEIGIRSEADRDDPVAGLSRRFDQSRAAGVVCVDDDAASRCDERQDPRLRCEVILKVAVIVEVVLCDVGDDGAASGVAAARRCLSAWLESSIAAQEAPASTILRNQ